MWSSSTGFRRYKLLAFVFDVHTSSEVDSMDGYKRNGHVVFDIKYHIIRVTKYRYKVLHTWTSSIESKAVDQARL